MGGAGSVEEFYAAHLKEGGGVIGWLYTTYTTVFPQLIECGGGALIKFGGAGRLYMEKVLTVKKKGWSPNLAPRLSSRLRPHVTICMLN